VLTPAEEELLRETRRGVLATIAADGRSRLVPIAFAFAISFTGHSKKLVLYSALDEKPKSVDDPRRLARVRDVLERPRVTVLVDRWSEDWQRLAWLRMEGTADLLEPEGEPAGEHATAVGLLRARYPQYATHRLEARPILRIAVTRAVSWGLAS
jgi:PPOX class probable F420-dependent enzyme